MSSTSRYQPEAAASPPDGAKDSLQVCSRSNLLRKIFVCYRMEEQRPRITGLELQYSCEDKRRRKRLVIGETLKGECGKSGTDTSGNTGTDTSDSGASRRSSVSPGTDTSDSGASRRSSVSLAGHGHVVDKESGDVTDQQEPGCRRSKSFLLRRGEHI